MIRLTAVIISFFVHGLIFAQSTEQKLVDRMKSLHELMINTKFFIDQYLDDSLSYGHSNGWVENKKEFIANLGNRLLYHSFKEDSIRVSVNRKVAHIRFIGDIDVTLDGKRSLYHLKVMEVWVKRGRSWKLFARQAVK